MQGTYRLKHPEKYMGDPTRVIYRSSWERRFMVYCDDTPAVLQWASEEFHIPYMSPVDHRMHRYFPDFLVILETNAGKQTMVIEIKPESQTVMPTKKRRNTKRFLAETATVAVNHAKWDAATQYCQDRGWKFVVLTERHLGIKY